MASTDINAISLCSGVGMLDEGVRAAFGHIGVELRTIAFAEWEAPAASQLVALMEAGALEPAPVWCGDFRRLGAERFRGCVDLVIAGFPCQDISIAGKRAGLDGKRSGLFFNILDIADACGASGLVLENVSAIATATATAVDEAEGTLEERAAARVVGELADRGWDAEWITLSASDVGASHGRARWFCLAWRRQVGHARHDARGPELGQQPPGATGGPGQPGEGGDGGDVAGSGPEIDAGRQSEPGRGAVADAGQPRLPHAQQRGQPGQPHPHGGRAVAEFRGIPLFAPGPLDPRWTAIVANRPDLAPAVEPGVRMLADGMAYLVDESRAHQLRQVGNGVVPLQAAAAFVELLRRAAGR